MVVVEPNGVITYIRGLYCGCASDKAITMDTGIIQNMVSGGCVMVDKGFNIHDLPPQGVRINILPFLLEPQFTSRQCIETR